MFEFFMKNFRLLFKNILDAKKLAIRQLCYCILVLRPTNKAFLSLNTLFAAIICQIVTGGQIALGDGHEYLS